MDGVCILKSLQPNHRCQVPDLTSCCCFVFYKYIYLAAADILGVKHSLLWKHQGQNPVTLNQLDLPTRFFSCRIRVSQKKCQESKLGMLQRMLFTQRGPRAQKSFPSSPPSPSCFRICSLRGQFCTILYNSNVKTDNGFKIQNAPLKLMLCCKFLHKLIVIISGSRGSEGEISFKGSALTCCLKMKRRNISI